jgi:hypothetical protein
LLDAFWRAVAYCLHPKVIGLSLLPLVIGAGLAVGLGWAYWEPAVAGVRGWLESWSLVEAGLKMVEGALGPSFRTLLAPLLVVLLAAPVIVVMSVLLVSLLMSPAIASLVAARRFPTLEKRHGAGVLRSVLWSLFCTIAALAALAISVPLWFIPPLVLIVPPLIWGWLTYRVMSFDMWAEHADANERRTLMRRHRWQLLAIGVVSGYLGAAPSLIWAVSAAALVFAPVLIGVSMWLYTLVFAFSALWFAHFCLGALAALRAESMPVAVRPSASVGEVIDVQARPTTNGALPGAPQPPSL